LTGCNFTPVDTFFGSIFGGSGFLNSGLGGGSTALAGAFAEAFVWVAALAAAGFRGTTLVGLLSSFLMMAGLAAGAGAAAFGAGLAATFGSGFAATFATGLAAVWRQVSVLPWRAPRPSQAPLSRVPSRQSSQQV
jgi:hypothetical protein